MAHDSTDDALLVGKYSILDITQLPIKLYDSELGWKFVTPEPDDARLLESMIEDPTLEPGS